MKIDFGLKNKGTGCFYFSSVKVLVNSKIDFVQVFAKDENEVIEILKEELVGFERVLDFRYIPEDSDWLE